MTPEYAVGLLGLAASLCAVVALVWALHRRQLRTDDQAMYEALSDDEPDFTDASASAPANPWTRRLFALTFAALFGLIGWMIVQTVRVASQGASQIPAMHGSRTEQ